MRVLLFATLSILILMPETGSADKITSDYAEVEFSTLKITPEKYNNKKVVYTETYQRYSSTFPTYMDRSGLRSDKNMLLDIGDVKMPVVVKKDDAMIEFIGKLQPRSTVKVYGKIRKFRVEAKGAQAFVGIAPDYYVEADKIELTAEPEPGKREAAPDNTKRPIRQRPIR